MSMELIKKCNLAMNSKERWVGLEIKKDGQIKCVDNSVLKRFEGIIKDLLKNIAKSIA